MLLFRGDCGDEAELVRRTSASDEDSSTHCVADSDIHRKLSAVDESDADIDGKASDFIAEFHKSH